MKNFKRLLNLFGGSLVAFALMIGTFSSNSACALYLYHPKVPRELQMRNSK